MLKPEASMGKRHGQLKIHVSKGLLLGLLAMGFGWGGHLPEAQALSYTYTTILTPETINGNNAGTLAEQNRAFGINNSGAISGSLIYFDQGYIDNNGTFTLIPGNFNGGGSQVFGINNNGAVVGSGGSQSGNFIYNNGAYTYLSGSTFDGFPLLPRGINNNNEVVGNNYFNPSNGYTNGFLYDNGNYTRILPIGAGNYYSGAFGINDSGEIVGYYDNNGTSLGFVDNNGSFTSISAPNPSDNLVLYGISDNGYMVGTISGFNSFQSFIDENGTFTTINVPGATQTVVRGVNDSGDVVGYYTNSSGTFGFLGTPVSSVSATPEPSALVLVGSGLLLLGVARVFRQRFSLKKG